MGGMRVSNTKLRARAERMGELVRGVGAARRSPTLSMRPTATLRVAILMLAAGVDRANGACAARGSRRRAARCDRRRSVRLGVGAALVDGPLVERRRSDRGRRGRAVGLASPNGRGVATRVHRPPGQRLRGRRPDRRRRRRLPQAGEALLATGVTAFQPTFITAPRRRSLEAVPAVPDSGEGPAILGAHLEGPFLVAEPRSARIARGAAAIPIPRSCGGFSPRAAFGRSRSRPSSTVRSSSSTSLVERGITVSRGHTDATAAEAQPGLRPRGRTVTHLFNAMRVGTPRAPGDRAGGARALRRHVQIIVDEHHLAPDTVAVAWRAAGGRLRTGERRGRRGRRRRRRVLARDRAGAGRERGVRGARRDARRERADHDRGGPHLHALGATLRAGGRRRDGRPGEDRGPPDLGRLASGSLADVVVVDDRLEIQRVLVAGNTRVAA